MAIIDRSIRPRLGAGVGLLGGWEGDKESGLLLFVFNMLGFTYHHVMSFPGAGGRGGALYELPFDDDDAIYVVRGLGPSLLA